MGPDPYSPEWTIMWTLQRALRAWIKPKDEHRPAIIADQVVKDLRQSNWHLIKGLSNSSWEHNSAAIKLRQEQQQEFDDRLKALQEMVRATAPSSEGKDGI